jgi:hypothetical protein
MEGFPGLLAEKLHKYRVFTAKKVMWVTVAGFS